MRRLFTAYNSSLKSHPWITNSITTGILMGLGDILAQFLFPKQKPTTTSTTTSPSTSTTTINDIPSSSISIDYGRTIRAVLFGSVIFSPVCHTWYKFLGTKVHWKSTTLNSNSKSNSNKLKTTIFRVFIDQTIFVPFICYPIYYTSMTVLENIGKKNNMNVGVGELIREKMKEKWWVTVRTNWMVWPFIQFTNFYFLPIHLRLLVINFASIGWNTFLSYMLHKSK